MFNNIKIIYAREQLILSKKRVFPIMFTLVSAIVALFTLIFINRILFTSKIEGTVDYSEILFLYERIWDAIMLIGIIFVVFIASTTVNFDKKCNIIDNILATRIIKSDIIYGKYASIIFSTTQIVLVTMPMCILSTFFGGISIIKIIITLIFTLFYLSFFSSAVIMLSSIFSNENWSVVISAVLGVVFLFIYYYFRNIIISNNMYCVITIVGLVLLTIICHVVSINSKIFDK